MEGPESRVDFGMAEALAFGALALHRGARPPHALRVAQQAPAGDDLRTAAQRGQPASSAPLQCFPLLVRAQRKSMAMGSVPAVHERGQRAHAEADAASGLNLGAYSVRLSGQDVERGTFNHRHAVLYDNSIATRCCTLQDSRFCVRQASNFAA